MSVKLTVGVKGRIIINSKHHIRCYITEEGYLFKVYQLFPRDIEYATISDRIILKMFKDVILTELKLHLSTTTAEIISAFHKFIVTNYSTSNNTTHEEIFRKRLEELNNR